MYTSAFESDREQQPEHSQIQVHHAFQLRFSKVHFLQVRSSSRPHQAGLPQPEQHDSAPRERIEKSVCLLVHLAYDQRPDKWECHVLEIANQSNQRSSEGQQRESMPPPMACQNLVWQK